MRELVTLLVVNSYTKLLQDRYLELVGELGGRLRQVREIPAPSPSPAPPPAPTPLPPLDNARVAKEVRSILNQQVNQSIFKLPILLLFIVLIGGNFNFPRF